MKWKSVAGFCSVSRWGILWTASHYKLNQQSNTQISPCPERRDDLNDIKMQMSDREHGEKIQAYR